MGLFVERYILHIFLLNWLLIIADAALGYHVAPLLVRMREEGDDDGQYGMTMTMIRRLLAVVVALYMFFNCLAYFRVNFIMLLIICVIVILDLLFQCYVRIRSGRSSGSP